MHFLKAALSLAFLASSALAQGVQLTLPPPGSTLTAGSDITVQITADIFIQSEDFAAIVVGLVQCNGGDCPASESMGDILYQGPYTPLSGNRYANYTVTVPGSFSAGGASLNVISLYMVGLSNVPAVEYLNQNVTVVA